MRTSAQAKFKRRVKSWLIEEDKTVSELAKLVGRRRDTVSTAINQPRFPLVKREILRAIA